MIFGSKNDIYQIISDWPLFLAVQDSSISDLVTDDWLREPVKNYLADFAH